MPDRRWIVSGATAIRWRAGRIEISVATSGVRLHTDDQEILQVINTFARACAIGEAANALSHIPSNELVRCVESFIADGVLVEADGAHPEKPSWDPAAIAFHRSWRGLDCGLAITNAPRNEKPAREIPLDFSKKSGDLSIPWLLRARHSVRSWPRIPIGHHSFSSFLEMSAGDYSIDGSAETERRAYPSGGGLYSLECYPVIAADGVEGIPSGVYRYRPTSHALELLTLEPNAVETFLAAAGRSAGSEPPPVMIAVTSHIAPVTAAYGTLAYSLVLKEVGALFQTFYLVAEHLGLAACALGAGTPETLLAKLTKTDPLKEPLVGEFMLGPR